MRDIKIKTNMDKPKALTKNFTPKDADSLQKKKLERQEASKEPESRDGVRYATDKTEYGMRNGVLAAAAASRRMVKQYHSDRGEIAYVKCREVEQTVPPNIPSGNATTAKSVPVPNADEPPATSSQSVHQAPRSAKAAPQERGRQKTIQDAKKRKNIQQHLAEKKVPKSRAAEPRAKIFVQRKVQREMLRQSVQQSKAAARKLGGMSIQAGKTIGRAVISAAGSIAAACGSAVGSTMILAVLIIAAIVASPFGILFSGESQGPRTVPISAAVAQINDTFHAELEALQTAEDYDAITVTGQAADWVEILAVFAVKVAGSDTDAADVATMDADRVERLKTVFWDMTTIEHEVEVIHHPGTENEEGWTERNLYITISAKTAEEMKTVYVFNRRQSAALAELLEQRTLLHSLLP